MVAKIQSLTTGVDKLQKSADNLLKTLTKINDVSASAITRTNGALDAVGGQMGNGQGPQVSLGTDNARFPDTTSRAYQAMGGGGGGGGGFGGGGGGFGGPGNSMSGSFGNFSVQGREDQLRMQGQLNVVTSSVNMASSLLPDVGSAMNNAAMYYQAGLKSPGINRKNLERSMLRAMRGGFSDPMGGAITANVLADAGFGPGTQNFKQAAAEVGGAYRYLGMDNAVASQAIAGMHQGPMGANLYQYGMTTYDPSTGKNKTMGQIANELMGVMGGTNASVAQVQMSYQKGALGANLRTMGFSQEQQDIIYQSMIDKASGRDPDLRNAKPVGDNQNQMLIAQGKMSSSQGNLLMNAEEDMIKGFEDAAVAVEKFNAAISLSLNNPILRFMGVGNELAQAQGFFGGIEGSTLGNAKNAAKGVVQGFLQVLLGDRNPMQGQGNGGGTTGYGAAFGKGGGGGGGGVPPVKGTINAGYGAKGSDMWGSTNGNHTGMDYNVPVGTPVKAAMEGVVTQVDINSDYGTSIMVDHPNGMQTIYAHLSSKDVKVGDRVTRGQQLGKSGKSGNASGPHLHFEVRNGKNNPVDPSELLSGGHSILNAEYATVIPSYSQVLGKSLASGGSSGANNNTPYVGSGNYSKEALDDPTLRSKLEKAGFSGQGLENAMKIVRLESGGRPGALNPDASTGDYSLGLFQINMIGGLGQRRNEKYLKEYGKYGYTGMESLYDPDINARIAYDISKEGTKWSNAWVNSSRKAGIGGSTSGFGGAGLNPPEISGGSKTVNINLRIDKTSEDEARRFAKRIKSYLEDDLELNRMGSA
jgi:murein DD-endopeptidase MepM/ murein hydrolase activator NlpD